MGTVAALPGDVSVRGSARAALQLVDVVEHGQIGIVPSGDLHCLRGLRQKWTKELQRLIVSDPERAQHLAEALDDLAILIDRARSARSPLSVDGAPRR